MVDQQRLLQLLATGMIAEFQGIPKVVETVISRIFLFGDATVLKLYKRDNAWWNSEMQDISEGTARADFIRNDFAFNQSLNPIVYLGLKSLVIENGTIVVREPREDDDELVIIMGYQDQESVLTRVLTEKRLQAADYSKIGTSLVRAKQRIPRSFLPTTRMPWPEQMNERIKDLAVWVLDANAFPAALAHAALERLRLGLDRNINAFSALTQDDLTVCIDCNSENLIFANGELSFMDAYPPKEAWRAGSFELDVFRVGADVFALSGDVAYKSYLDGVTGASQKKIDTSLADFYLLYGALIAGPYFLMLGKQNPNYLGIANKYIAFIQHLLES